MVLLAPKDYGRSTIFYAWFLYQSELWLGREGVRKSGLIEKTVTVFVEPCFILFYKQTQKKWILFHEHVLITSMMTWFCYWTSELTVVSV